MLRGPADSSTTTVVEMATSPAVDRREDESLARLFVNWDTFNRFEVSTILATFNEILETAEREGFDRRECVRQILLIVFKRRNHLKSMAEGEGAGEKSIFIETLLAIIARQEFDDLVLSILPMIPHYGYWKDLRILGEEIIVRSTGYPTNEEEASTFFHPICQTICKLFADQMTSDATVESTAATETASSSESAANEVNNKVPSNACKYAPHNGRYSNKPHKMGAKK
jgi:hypothetical protein